MNNRKAFTIVELLTVVTIIALLLGILLPSIAMVRAKAKETAQKAQFMTIEMTLEAFNRQAIFNHRHPAGLVRCLY